MKSVLWILLAILSFGIAAASDFFVHWAVNAGGTAIVASDLIHYQADDIRQNEITEGHPIDLTSPRDAAMYLNNLEAEDLFSYKISVPKDGNFLLVLKWAEIREHIKSGDRVMDIVLNGKHKVVQNLDVFKVVGGFRAHFEYVYFKIVDNKVHWKQEESFVYGGEICIDIVKNKFYPFVSAIVLFEGKVEVIPKLPWTIQQEQNVCVIKEVKESHHPEESKKSEALIEISNKLGHVNIFYKLPHSQPGIGKLLAIGDLVRNDIITDADTGMAFSEVSVPE
jgi:hypothetical protein